MVNEGLSGCIKIIVTSTRTCCGMIYHIQRIYEVWMPGAPGTRGAQCAPLPGLNRVNPIPLIKMAVLNPKTVD